MRRILVGLALAVAVPVSSAEVHEVAPNYYLTRLADMGRWTVWRAERADQADCFATLAPSGAVDPVPTKSYRGVSYGAMYVEFAFNDLATAAHPDGMVWQLRSSGWRLHESGLRVAGDKFYGRSSGGSRALLAIDGEVREAFVTSYEYPAIMEGRHEETGTFDFTGAASAVAAVEQCREELRNR